MRTRPTAPRIAVFVASVLVSLSVAAFATASHARVAEPAEFDRLDGHGPSKTKVDVVRWGEHLEVHVYPKGRLKALGMKMDEGKGGRKDALVMVIEYALRNVPYTMIRRAALDRRFASFRAYRDPTETEFDKIVVSDTPLPAPYVAYALAPPPTQLFPDHFGEPEPSPGEPNEPSGEDTSAGKPTGKIPAPRASRTPPAGNDPPIPSVDENGAIRSFSF